MIGREIVILIFYNKTIGNENVLNIGNRSKLSVLHTANRSVFCPFTTINADLCGSPAMNMIRINSSI